MAYSGSVAFTKAPISSPQSLITGFFKPLGPLPRDACSPIILAAETDIPLRDIATSSNPAQIDMPQSSSSSFFRSSPISPQLQDPQKSSVPAVVPSIVAPSYAERFKSSLRNLRTISSPTYEEDGIPIVHAPESVLLQTATLWKGHIIAQFHGLIPPPAKIYSDLNPAWGKHGNITIRIVSNTSCFILVPCLSTRQWVLDVGYWQAGNCAFSVYPWSPEGLSELSDLDTAPTWAVLKNVPPQMYSLDGISVIASAIGEPLHTEKSKLDPFHFGDTKVKVEICLDSSPPTTVIVRDSMGNSVRVEVSYPRLPPKCCNCARFGHLLNRCPKPLMKKSPGKEVIKPFVAGGTVVADSKVSLAQAQEPAISKKLVDAIKALPLIPAWNGSVVILPQVKQRTRSRSRSRGSGCSSPQVDNLTNGNPPSVGSDLVTVDHRVDYDGPKDMVVPRPPANAHLAQSEVSQLRRLQAGETIPVSQNSEVFAKADMCPVKAVLLEPETTWTVVRNKKESKKHGKKEEVKVSGPVYYKSKKGKEKAITQGMFSGTKLAKYAASKSN